MAPEQQSNPYLTLDAGQRVCRQSQEALAQRLIPDWIIGDDVLEMGWGYGAWTGRLIEEYGRSSVVDCDAELLTRAGKIHGDALTTHVRCFENFNPPRRYSTILASFILEHVDDPVAVLLRTLDWLKPDGRLIVAVPNGHSLHRKLGVRMGLMRHARELGEADKLLGHKRVYELGTLLSDIDAGGYTIVRARGFFLKPLPQSLMATLPPEMLQAFIALGEDVPLDLAAEIVLACRPT
jgi:SAM-dependent methyltransferase